MSETILHRYAEEESPCTFKPHQDQMLWSRYDTNNEQRHTAPESRQWVASGKGPQAAEHPATHPTDGWDLGCRGMWQSCGIGLALRFHNYW